MASAAGAAKLTNGRRRRGRGSETMKDAAAAARTATYTAQCEECVHVAEFSPFGSGLAGGLLAYGGRNYVVVGTCSFQEEDTEIKGVEYNTLKTFHRGIRVDAIAWSPETKLDTVPQVLRLCTADADNKLRLLTSDLKDENGWKVIEGHADYINDLVFEPNDGKQIASVSDDHTCRIWDLEGNQKASFLLHSPGMSVCWHPEESFKLMVAEKNGIIRFYDLVTLQAILSLDCGQMPLMSADWCLGNTIKVGAVSGKDWFIWDITRSRWSRASENLFATTGCPGKINSQLLVHHLGHPQAIMIGSASVASGLSWHRTLPLCVIGGDHKLLFWMTEM
uniref:Nucleoporin Nup37 n=1 Tax=Callorhinchus milii TaxID=7868 RepID=A0A4W3IZQ5_CALMI